MPKKRVCTMQSLLLEAYGELSYRKADLTNPIGLESLSRLHARFFVIHC